VSKLPDNVKIEIQGCW